MSQRYWLDTNAYYLLYQPLAGDATKRLVARLTTRGNIRCSISKMTSLEIHSVLGKYARAQPSTWIACNRAVESQSGTQSCSHRWRPIVRERIKPPVLKRLNKLIHDAEQERGTLQARVHPVSHVAFTRASHYLQKYALRIPIGSHDALIAACFVEAQTAGSLGSICFVTSDRGLKRLLEAEAILHYDPQTDIEWSPPLPRGAAGSVPRSRPPSGKGAGE